MRWPEVIAGACNVALTAADKCYHTCYTPRIKRGQREGKRRYILHTEYQDGTRFGSTLHQNLQHPVRKRASANAADNACITIANSRTWRQRSSVVTGAGCCSREPGLSFLRRHLLHETHKRRGCRCVCVCARARVFARACGGRCSATALCGMTTDGSAPPPTCTQHSRKAHQHTVA